MHKINAIKEFTKLLTCSSRNVILSLHGFCNLQLTYHVILFLQRFLYNLSLHSTAGQILRHKYWAKTKVWLISITTILHRRLGPLSTGVMMSWCSTAYRPDRREIRPQIQRFSPQKLHLSVYYDDYFSPLSLTHPKPRPPLPSPNCRKTPHWQKRLYATLGRVTIPQISVSIANDHF